MSPDSFKRWLRDPHRTLPLIYHTGYLWKDREVNGAAADMARAAWAAYQKRKVLLVQRRCGAFNYEYIAIKRRRP